MTRQGPILNSRKAGSASEALMSESHSRLRYVLVTPAHNEEAYIEKTLQSVIHQTVLPEKWVIVDDGSTDRTPEIVGRYLDAHPWIELVKRPQRRERDFAGKVQAFNAGFEKIRDLDFEVVANLDADISFDPAYIEFVVAKFAADENLGVAGTIFEEEGYSSEKQSFEGKKHVAGGCQMFRKRCFDEIGGFLPNKFGGVDWIAVTTARMKGWKTQSFREKSFFHHRHLGTAEVNRVVSLFSYGEKDYYLGGHPLWEIFRVTYQATRRPYVIAGLAIGAGYCWASLIGSRRPVSRDFIEFHRREQMLKLKAILKSILTFRAVDRFDVLPD
jgi:poly-beta-1,6-N-acetyl-D-glucosamine synthase